MTITAHDTVSSEFIKCQNCSITKTCLPRLLINNDTSKLQSLVKNRLALKSGQHLARSQDTFSNLFIVRTGTFKSYTLSAEGIEQVKKFFFLGDVLGFEGIQNNSYPVYLRALEKSTVCEISYQDFLQITSHSPTAVNQLLIEVSQRLATETFIPRNSTAEARLAAFLLEVSQHFNKNHLSSLKFRLAMSRQDIGNYLGLALETVSRLLSRFHADNLIKVDTKHIQLLNTQALHKIANGIQ